MKRQAPHAYSNASPDVAAQMQHKSAQRMQQNARMYNILGRPDSFSAEQGHPYISSRVEEQWQWDRDVPLSSHPYTEGQGGNASQSSYQGQMRNPKVDLEKQANKEPRLHSHEQDMEIGYDDKPSPLTFEGLEQKFKDEIMKLVKEQSDAEDAENARHRDKIMEIKNQYQEKLSSLRTLQANIREEFLCKESQARLHQYQQAGMGHHLTKTGSSEAHGYREPAAAESHRTYGTGQFESYRERPPSLGGGRSQGTEARVPYAKGRVYNNNGARYY